MNREEAVPTLPRAASTRQPGRVAVPTGPPGTGAHLPQDGCNAMGAVRAEVMTLDRWHTFELPAEASVVELKIRALQRFGLLPSPYPSPSPAPQSLPVSAVCPPRSVSSSSSTTTTTTASHSPERVLRDGHTATSTAIRDRRRASLIYYSSSSSSAKIGRDASSSQDDLLRAGLVIASYGLISVCGGHHIDENGTRLGVVCVKHDLLVLQLRGRGVHLPLDRFCEPFIRVSCYVHVQEASSKHSSSYGHPDDTVQDQSPHDRRSAYSYKAYKLVLFHGQISLYKVVEKGSGRKKEVLFRIFAVPTLAGHVTPVAPVEALAGTASVSVHVLRFRTPDGARLAIRTAKEDEWQDLLRCLGPDGLTAASAGARAQLRWREEALARAQLANLDLPPPYRTSSRERETSTNMGTGTGVQRVETRTPDRDQGGVKSSSTPQRSSIRSLGANAAADADDTGRTRTPDTHHTPSPAASPARVPSPITDRKLQYPLAEQRAYEPQPAALQYAANIGSPLRSGAGRLSMKRSYSDFPQLQPAAELADATHHAPPPAPAHTTLYKVVRRARSFSTPQILAAADQRASSAASGSDEQRDAHARDSQRDTEPPVVPRKSRLRLADRLAGALHSDVPQPPPHSLGADSPTAREQLDQMALPPHSESSAASSRTRSTTGTVGSGSTSTGDDSGFSHSARSQLQLRSSFSSSSSFSASSELDEADYAYARMHGAMSLGDAGIQQQTHRDMTSVRGSSRLVARDARSVSASDKLRRFF